MRKVEYTVARVLVNPLTVENGKSHSESAFLSELFPLDFCDVLRYGREVAKKTAKKHGLHS